MKIFLQSVRPLAADLLRGHTDTIVLACTHFRLVEPELSAALPLAYVDGAGGIARRIEYLTLGQDWPDAPEAGRAVFTALSDKERALAPALAGFGLAELAEL